MMIDIKVRNKRYWDVAQKTDMIKLHPGRKRIVQMMKELVPFVEAAGDPLLNENIKFNKDLSVFFPRFRDLFNGLRTPVRGLEIKFNGKYYIDIYCYYDYRSDTLYSMPLSFLPGLAIRNKKLHDIIVECIKLLKQKDVPIIDSPFYDDDQYITENMREYIISEQNSYNVSAVDPDADRALAKREFDLFIEYKDKYVNKILSGSSNKGKVKSLIKKFKPANKIEKKVLQWCDMVIDAANEPNSLECFSEKARENYCKDNDIEMDDLYNDGQPVEIEQVMRFTWFGCAGYTDIERSNLGEMGGNFGQLEFYCDYECYSKDEIDVAREKFLKEWGMFPEKLTVLLEFGSDMIDELWDYIDGKLTAILD